MILPFKNFLQKYNKEFRERIENNRDHIEKGHWGISGHCIRYNIISKKQNT